MAGKKIHVKFFQIPRIKRSTIPFAQTPRIIDNFCSQNVSEFLEFLTQGLWGSIKLDVPNIDHFCWRQFATISALVLRVGELVIVFRRSRSRELKR